jgi:hypothetical protein
LVCLLVCAGVFLPAGRPRCGDCGRRLGRVGPGDYACATCTTWRPSPLAPRPTPPADDADQPLTWSEAVERAAEFSERLGFPVDAADVLAADHAWLERYGDERH